MYKSTVPPNTVTIRTITKKTLSQIPLSSSMIYLTILRLQMRSNNLSLTYQKIASMTTVDHKCATKVKVLLIEG